MEPVAQSPREHGLWNQKELCSNLGSFIYRLCDPVNEWYSIKTSISLFVWSVMMMIMVMIMMNTRVLRSFESKSEIEEILPSMQWALSTKSYVGSLY